MYDKIAVDNNERKEGNITFNDALLLYLRLYDVGLVVEDHSNSESKPSKFQIAARVLFICTIPQTG